MGNLHTKNEGRSTSFRPKKYASPIVWLPLLGTLIVAALALLLIPRSEVETRRDSPSSVAKSKPTASALPPAQHAIVDARGRRVEVVDDDWQTLWASPTMGSPLDLGYLPPGCQIIIALRTHELFRHAEGARLQATILGRAIELAAGGLFGLEDNPRDLPRMLVGLRLEDDGEWSATRVLYFDDDSIDTTQLKELRDRVAQLESGEHARQAFGTLGEMAYFFPRGHDPDRLVVAPRALVGQIIDLGGNPPPLRRDMERLVADTDSQRNVTVVFAPSAWLGEGGAHLANEMARLRDAIDWFLGDGVSAASISAHWGEAFFLEMLAVPTLDTPPQQSARQFYDRVVASPDLVSQYTADLDARPYGRQLVDRFPMMVEVLAKYTRSDVEMDHVVLRSYLPLAAGHNMLLGAELTLMEPPGTAGQVAEAAALPNAAPRPANSIDERLEIVTSLQFVRETLDSALQQLGREIGVSITIQGSDLQAEGITKNQSFGMAMENQPAAAILVEILRRANPDQTAADAANERQKLVYVVRPGGPEGGDRIVVTTRLAAQSRGETLPPIFTKKGP